MAPSKWVADIFHSFPHLDFNFQNTTLIFTPTDSSYQQALMFNGLIILFIAGLVFLVFTFYFLICSCYYCSSCFPSVLKPKPSRSRSFRFLIGFFAVLSCVPLGIGFYGNNKTKDGVSKFSTAVTNIHNKWDLYQLKNSVISRFIGIDAVNALKNLKKAFEKFFIPLPTLLSDLEKVLKDVSASINISSTYLTGSNFNMKDVTDDVLKYDGIRWWAIIGILLWHLLLVLSVIYGAWKERRFFISVIAIEGVLSMLFLLSSVGVDVPLSVGSADLCINPKASVTQYIKNPLYKVVQDYYLDCFNQTGNPLFKATFTPKSSKRFETRGAQYRKTNILLDSLDVSIGSLLKDPLVQQLLKNSTFVSSYISDLQNAVSKSKVDLDQLFKELDCKYINQQYRDGVNAVCFIVLYGLSMLILSALIISLFVTCILICLTPIWKSMAKLRTAPGSVHLITGSYSGPPGGREHFPDSSWDTSLDASYKSIDEDHRDQRDQREHQRAGRYDTSETVPLVLRRTGERPPSYHAVHGDTEFLSVEEDRKRHSAETAT